MRTAHLTSPNKITLLCLPSHRLLSFSLSCCRDWDTSSVSHTYATVWLLQYVFLLTHNTRNTHNKTFVYQYIDRFTIINQEQKGLHFFFITKKEPWILILIFSHFYFALFMPFWVYLFLGFQEIFQYCHLMKGTHSSLGMLISWSLKMENQFTSLWMIEQVIF